MAFIRSIGIRRWSRRREKSFTLLLPGREETVETADYGERRSVIGSICDPVFREID